MEIDVRPTAGIDVFLVRVYECMRACRHVHTLS